MNPPPPSNPIQPSMIIQPNPAQADSLQGHIISTQSNSLPATPVLNKISSPPMQGTGVFQPTKIHHTNQGIPISLNLIQSGITPNLLSNTNHNLSPATVNQLHALLLKSPAKVEQDHPNIQPNCTTLQQPRLAKPVPSKPTAVSQGKPSNPMYILQGQLPQNIQIGIGRGGQTQNIIQGPAPQNVGTNLIQIVSSQTQGQPGGNKVLLNNSSGLTRQEGRCLFYVNVDCCLIGFVYIVLLLNPNAIGNANNGFPQQIKISKPSSASFQNRAIFHQTPSGITTTTTATTTTPQSQISDDSIRQQQLRIEQLKKQLLAAENTKSI